MNEEQKTTIVVEEEKAPVPRQWVICLVDEGPDAKLPGQLIGYETVTAVDPPPRSPGRFTAPNGCDLALLRYRLIRYQKGGREAEGFFPIQHPRDEAVEFNPDSNGKVPDIVSTLVDALLELDRGAVMTPLQKKRLEDFRRTFDYRG